MNWLRGFSFYFVLQTKTIKIKYISQSTVKYILKPIKSNIQQLAITPTWYVWLKKRVIIIFFILFLISGNIYLSPITMVFITFLTAFTAFTTFHCFSSTLDGLILLFIVNMSCIYHTMLRVILISILFIG